MRNDPSLAQPLASALAKICYSPVAPTFGQETFEDLCAGDDRAREYGPTNECLLDPLLSLKVGLANSVALGLFWSPADGLKVAS